MKTIETLFDPTKDIHRAIEKVITYDASQAHRLKAEIGEYIVTQSIEEQFEKLLERMQAAMRDGGQNEVGVWVSGFYGSGKSSFTKYLGLAFDKHVQIDGIAFIKHLQDRLHKPQTKALLSGLVKEFPAAVVMLDLASEMLAGATMEDVSTVLFYKVLQFAGYSRNLKVAALERRLQKDGRFEAFERQIQKDLGTDWPSIQNDPLVVDSLIPEIAHQFYPAIFKTPTVFNTQTSDFIQFENERVQEMLDIVRQATGHEYVIFIIDEVGQYIGSRQNLILNLDGLAKNLKQLGNGKVWIISTAQQTLTEDDPRAALNSPELYKLKDRFPIRIDLESHDIKEICYKRLLAKAPDGEARLGKLFEQNGQQLRHNTKLKDAKYYDSAFTKETFINLYPFLPAHFDILLHLLGALAKSTGGIGLRSAIKVVQDILIEPSGKQPPMASQAVGRLVTTVTLYDALEKDIRRAFPSIHQAVNKTLIRLHEAPLHHQVAKTVAVLQILDNLPVNIHNVSGLMHPYVDAAALNDDVEQAVNAMINDPLVPFGEQDGNLCFFSEKLNDIEQERAQIPLRSIEIRRIVNDALKETLQPLPATRLNGSMVVKTGLKSQNGAILAHLAGERETIQTIIELCSAADFDTVRTRLIDESRVRSSRFTVYLPAPTDPALEPKTAAIYRCREICNRYRNEPDQEVREYCTAQMDRAVKLGHELQHLLKRCLAKGAFIFRGRTQAVDTLDQNPLEACKIHLADVAAQVFDRHAQAPVRVETGLAEKFLKAGGLAAVTSQNDPLGLVRAQGGAPSVNTNHPALKSIHDYIDRNGAAEGKRLIDHFASAPFGWSPDTLRYLIAALLSAGEIKLKVSGREVSANGQQAVNALKSNNAFRRVGVALRYGKPSNEILARTAERMTALTGESVIPLEAEISKAAVKHLPQFQSRFAPLGAKLEALGLPGAERVQFLSHAIADLLFTDASDAPERLGGEQSDLYDSLQWAREADTAFQQGLETTIKELRRHCHEITQLPEVGAPGRLRRDLEETLTLVTDRLAADDFHKHATDLNTLLTRIKTHVGDAAVEMHKAQTQTIEAAQNDLHRLEQWQALTPDERAGVEAQFKGFHIQTTKDLEGVKRLITQEFNIHSTLADIRRRIIDIGAKRAIEKEEALKQKALEEKRSLLTVTIPAEVASLKELNRMLETLKQIRADVVQHEKFKISFKFDSPSGGSQS